MKSLSNIKSSINMGLNKREKSLDEIIFTNDATIQIIEEAREIGNALNKGKYKGKKTVIGTRKNLDKKLLSELDKLERLKNQNDKVKERNRKKDKRKSKGVNKGVVAGTLLGGAALGGGAIYLANRDKPEENKNKESENKTNNVNTEKTNQNNDSKNTDNIETDSNKTNTPENKVITPKVSNNLNIKPNSSSNEVKALPNINNAISRTDTKPKVINLDNGKVSVDSSNLNVQQLAENKTIKVGNISPIDAVNSAVLSVRNFLFNLKSEKEAPVVGSNKVKLSIKNKSKETPDKLDLEKPVTSGENKGFFSKIGDTISNAFNKVMGKSSNNKVLEEVKTTLSNASPASLNIGARLLSESTTGGKQQKVTIQNVKDLNLSDDQAKGIIAKYLEQARKNAQGARYSQDYRLSEKVYDCSSFVSRTLRDSGFPISPSNTTSTLGSALNKIGFRGYPFNVSQLQPGDVMLAPGHHTEFYSGVQNGQKMMIGAHSTKSGVSEKAFYNIGYSSMYRLSGSVKMGEVEGATGENGTAANVPADSSSGSSSGGGSGSSENNDSNANNSDNKNNSQSQSNTNSSSSGSQSNESGSSSQSGNVQTSNEKKPELSQSNSDTSAKNPVTKDQQEKLDKKGDIVDIKDKKPEPESDEIKSKRAEIEKIKTEIESIKQEAADANIEIKQGQGSGWKIRDGEYYEDYYGTTKKDGKNRYLDIGWMTEQEYNDYTAEDGSKLDSISDEEARIRKKHWKKQKELEKQQEELAELQKKQQEQEKPKYDYSNLSDEDKEKKTNELADSIKSIQYKIKEERDSDNPNQDKINELKAQLGQQKEAIFPLLGDSKNYETIEDTETELDLARLGNGIPRSKMAEMRKRHFLNDLLREKAIAEGNVSEEKKKDDIEYLTGEINNLQEGLDPSSAFYKMELSKIEDKKELLAKLQNAKTYDGQQPSTLEEKKEEIAEKNNGVNLGQENKESEKKIPNADYQPSYQEQQLEKEIQEQQALVNAAKQEASDAGIELKEGAGLTKGSRKTREAAQLQFGSDVGWMTKEEFAKYKATEFMVEGDDVEETTGITGKEADIRKKHYEAQKKLEEKKKELRKVQEEDDFRIYMEAKHGDLTSQKDWKDRYDEILTEAKKNPESEESKAILARDEAFRKEQAEHWEENAVGALGRSSREQRQEAAERDRMTINQMLVEERAEKVASGEITEEKRPRFAKDLTGSFQEEEWEEGQKDELKNKLLGKDNKKQGEVQVVKGGARDQFRYDMMNDEEEEKPISKPQLQENKSAEHQQNLGNLFNKFNGGKAENPITKAQVQKATNDKMIPGGKGQSRVDSTFVQPVINIPKDLNSIPEKPNSNFDSKPNPAVTPVQVNKLANVG